ncbi:hypothetical protein QNH20_19215 [Neobacillus sp. WH10]|uniref:hypothetical protein n=1 Tax=Neobacillus sp. WH10 TaxID=3047873 RepID=UPI0024C1A1E9|nr:hypothetical protein [Neobacillus sp. WH10]WHY76236.1 hypothetical protein QNH20_19215 [Neobacillus sp. WH10]
MGKFKVIDIDLQTNKLVDKLRAISNYTSALADELEEIDKIACPSCGSALDIETLFADDIIIQKNFSCKKCVIQSGLDLEK